MIDDHGRALDYLMNIDPDELVDVLRLSSTDIINAFPEQVMAYLEEQWDVEDEEENHHTLDS